MGASACMILMIRAWLDGEGGLDAQGAAHARTEEARPMSTPCEAQLDRNRDSAEVREDDRARKTAKRRRRGRASEARAHRGRHALLGPRPRLGAEPADGGQRSGGVANLCVQALLERQVLDGGSRARMLAPAWRGNGPGD